MSLKRAIRAASVALAAAAVGMSAQPAVWRHALAVIVSPETSSSAWPRRSGRRRSSPLGQGEDPLAAVPGSGRGKANGRRRRNSFQLRERSSRC